MNSFRSTLFALATAGFVVCPVWLLHAQPAQEPLYRAVACTDVGIDAIDSRGSKKSIAWGALSRVAIRTTDDGPRYDDVFWEIFAGGPTVALVYPGGAIGELECLTAMQERLQGFNDEQLIRAMGSALNAYFVLWERRQ